VRLRRSSTAASSRFGRAHRVTALSGPFAIFIPIPVSFSISHRCLLLLFILPSVSPKNLATPMPGAEVESF
jgi:hypothetical protein